MQRRVRHPFVVGAALLVFALAAACGDGTDPIVAPADAVSTPSVVATTAPAADEPTAVPVLPTPTALVVPAPPAEPTDTPTTVPTEAPTAETVSPATQAATTPTVPASSSPVPAPTVPAAGSQQVLAANGAEVYTLNCARCHGENGLGSAQYSAPLVGVGAKYSTQGMIAELTNGHPVTFGFADRLSAEEIASVVAYVKTAFG